MTTQLDSRYGRTPARSRRTRTIAIAAAAAVVVVVVSWVVWVGLFSPSASLDSRDLGYSEIAGENGGEAIEVRYEVTADAGASVSCALQALSHDFAIVGWKVVELPPSDTRTRQFREVVRTSEPAVTGLIYTCWLT
jgi:hypothetical protein